MTKPLAHIMTATPTYTGDVNADYALSLALASAHCYRNGMIVDPRFAPGFSLVEYGRNWLVAEFLATTNATHLFWIDSDLYFQPNRVHTFVDLMLKRGIDVLAGVYTTKDEDDAKRMYPYASLGPVENGIQEAERVPGGFMCMSRRAIEAVVAKCETMWIEQNGENRLSPRMFDTMLHKKRLFGEDYIACARLIDAGFKVYVYPDVHFKHYGRKAWPAHLSEQLALEEKEGVEGQGSPAVWKRNAERSVIHHVLHQSADSDASVPASGDSGRDAAAECSPGSERIADSEPVSAGEATSRLAAGLVRAD